MNATTHGPCDLPSGWAWVQLAELAADVPRAITDGPFGSNLKSEHYTADGPQVIRLQNIGDGAFLSARASISVERFNLLQAHEALAGDVVVASLGDTLPRACVVPAGLGPAIVKADCARIRPGAAVNPRYLMHALNSPLVRGQAAAVVHGVGRQRLPLSELKKLLVPLAPRGVQDELVADLDTAFAKTMTALAHFRSARDRLIDYRMSSAHQALQGDWPHLPLKEVLVSLRNGVFASRPALSPPGTAIFRISAVRPMHLTVDDVRYAPPADDHPRFLVAPGDLLFTRYSGNAEFVGACALVPEGTRPTLHPDKLIRAVVDRSKVQPEFLELACSAGTTRDDIRARRKTSAGQVGIAGRELAEVRVPVPPLPQQAAIAAQMRRELTGVAGVEARLVRAEARADNFRQSLLLSALSGGSTNRDAADRALVGA